MTSLLSCDIEFPFVSTRNEYYSLVRDQKKKKREHLQTQYEDIKHTQLKLKRSRHLTDIADNFI